MKIKLQSVTDDLLSQLATKYTNKAKNCPDPDEDNMVRVDLAWLHGCFQEMGQEVLDTLIERFKSK